MCSPADHNAQARPRPRARARARGVISRLHRLRDTQQVRIYAPMLTTSTEHTGNRSSSSDSARLSSTDGCQFSMWTPGPDLEIGHDALNGNPYERGRNKY